VSCAPLRGKPRREITLLQGKPVNTMFHYVYVLQSKKDGKLYVGYTKNIFKRLKVHNKGLSHYTKKYAPWILIYFEGFLNQEDALRREKYLKTSIGKRTLKLQLRKYFENERFSG
jgi:putative endonuclease